MQVKIASSSQHNMLPIGASPRRSVVLDSNLPIMVLAETHDLSGMGARWLLEKTIEDIQKYESSLGMAEEIASKYITMMTAELNVTVNQRYALEKILRSLSC